MNVEEISMDTEKCKALITTIEEGSLSAAADRLGYTPSGISRMMAALEEETGFRLLARSRNGVVPTAECEKMIPVFRELIYWGEQYRQYASEICGLERGTVTVGTSYSSYYRWLSELVAKFCSRYPGIEVRTLQANSSNLYLAMEEHRADFCIVSRREPDFRWIPIKEDPMVVWVPEDHRAAGAGFYRDTDLETEGYIETFPEEETDNARLLADRHIKPMVKFSTTDNYATYCMVESGLGVALMNGMSMGSWQGRVRAVPIEPPEMVSIGFICQRDVNISPAARRFIDFALEYSSEMK